MEDSDRDRPVTRRDVELLAELIADAITSRPPRPVLLDCPDAAAPKAEPASLFAFKQVKAAHRRTATG